jgi:hypothetical protein
MSPLELERAVSRATGESRREIKRRGFQIIEVDVPDEGDDASPGIVDWDQLDAERTALFP